MTLKRNAEARTQPRAKDGHSGLRLWLIVLSLLGLGNTLLLVLLLVRPTISSGELDLASTRVLDSPSSQRPVSTQVQDGNGSGTESESHDRAVQSGLELNNELRDDASLEEPRQQASDGAASTQAVPPVVHKRAEEIRLQILNGTNTPKLAAKLGDALTRLGYDVLEKGNYKGAHRGETLIFSRDEDSFAALQIATELGLGADRIRMEQDPELVDISVTIVIGTDHRSLRLH